MASSQQEAEAHHLRRTPKSKLVAFAQVTTGDEVKAKVKNTVN